MSYENLQNKDCRAAIENLPHLAEKMCSLWNSRDLDVFVQAVLMDSRDGERQGLPLEVAGEMMFIAKLNSLVRAMEAAPRLQMSVAEAGQAIHAGDRVAAGLPARDGDPWSEHALPRDQFRPAAAPPAKSAALRAPAPKAQASKPAAAAAPLRPGNTNHYLSLFLNETPPIPATVRVDLTAPITARTQVFPNEMQPPMSWEFFRCLAHEIQSQGVEELFLSHLGSAAKCAWVPEAIRFAKQQCRFHQVSLRVDLLTASERQLIEAMANGLDSLVIDFNLACKSWRVRADELAAKDPGYFSMRFSHLLQKRDELATRTQHRCLIKVQQIGKTLPGHRLTPLLESFAEQADGAGIEWLPDAQDLRHCDAGGGGRGAGDCLCWVPFIQANVTTSGQLVVCAHDSLGESRVADLKETEFAEAWHSPAFRQTRRELLKGTMQGTLCGACPRGVH